jgi:hypothetical protein
VILAHIAGLPVEETILALAPAGLLGLVVALRSATARAARRLLRQRPAPHPDAPLAGAPAPPP